MNAHRRSLFMLVACVVMVLPMFGSAAAQDETGIVMVDTYVCPEGTDPASVPDDLATQCGESSEPIGILVTNGSGYANLTGELNPQQAPQQVEIEGVPAGDIVIAPQLPDGYEIARVSCGDGDGAMEPVSLNLDGGAPWNLQAGATVHCQVVVVPVVAGATPVASPVAATSSLTVAVHGCPAGFEGTSAVEFVDACAGHPVSNLYVSDLPDYYASASTTGIAGVNSVTFTDVPAAKLGLMYMYPRSFTTLAVYCDQGTGDDDPSTWLAGSIISGMTIEVPIEQGAQVTCHWFNDAGDVDGDVPGNTLEVMAWNCPAGTSPSDDGWSAYLRECEEPSHETTFALTGETAPDGTISNDWHLWQGVPAGEFTLEADLPEGYGEPVIFCATNVEDVTRIERPSKVSDPYPVVFEAGPPQITNCDWFNFPPGDGGAMAVTNPSLEVSVYTCPSFTYVGPEECTVDDSGVEFTLLQWNGDPAVWSWERGAMVQMGSDGVYTFDDLEAGDYWPLATNGTWCHVESGTLDASGRWIDVEPGEVTSVAVYSCISPET